MQRRINIKNSQCQQRQIKSNMPIICIKDIRVVAALNYLITKYFHHGHHLRNKICDQVVAVTKSNFLSSLYKKKLFSYSELTKFRLQTFPDPGPKKYVTPSVPLSITNLPPFNITLRKGLLLEKA